VGIIEEKPSLFFLGVICDYLTTAPEMAAIGFLLLPLCCHIPSLFIVVSVAS
jgi:hypothetical protein